MFFSVKRPMKIAGKTYIPCICYTVSKFMELTVDKLVREGKAEKYNEMVFFQNGKVIPSEKEIKAREKAERKARKEADKKAKESKEIDINETETETLIDETEGF